MPTILTSICLLMHVCAGGQNARYTLHDPAKKRITTELLRTEIGFLTDSICSGRGTGTAGSVEAAAWIARKFRNSGLLPFDGRWNRTVQTPNGTAGQNILGFLPGSSKTHSDRYIIVGTHYDHLGTIDGRLFPGADANASGVVALTSLAEMLATTKRIGRSYSYNVIFAAFDAKEMDMAGSRALWEMIRDGKLTDPVSGKRITRDKIAVMVNIDQVGSTLSPLDKDRKEYLIMLDGTMGHSSHKSRLSSCNTRHNIGLDLGFTYYGSENFTKLFYRLSDQKVFAENWIPAVMFTSGITMNNNKTWDNADSLDMEVLLKRIHLMYHWIFMTI